MGGILLQNAAVVISFVMRRTTVFSKAIPYLGILTHGLDLTHGIFGPFLPTIGVVFLVSAGPLYPIWFFLTGRRFLQLAARGKILTTESRSARKHNPPRLLIARENTEMNLGSRMVLRFTIGLILVAALLFIPAGTLSYWQGWCYLALFLSLVLLVPFICGSAIRNWSRADCAVRKRFVNRNS